MYSVRQTQSVLNGLDNGAPQGGMPSTKNSQPPLGVTARLPSQNRDVSTGDLDCPLPSGDTHSYFPPLMQPPGPNMDASSQAGIVEIDMDFSPEVGHGDRNPPSDHPTPSTLNSSSNTSYSMSGIDIPSPGKKHQKHGLARPGPGSTTGAAYEPVSSVHISSTKAELSQVPDVVSMPGNTYQNSNGSGLGTTEVLNAFTAPNGWDLSNSMADITNLGFDNMTTDALSESQWAQILNNNGNGADWDNWRPS